ncbi:hypothetical protein KAJ27_10900 [bacterium]|nr:hypothetical protein [bacterium]
MDGLIGFAIFGFVIYSIFKNVVINSAGKNSESSGDFLANIDKIIKTAYENTQQTSTTSSSSKVKQYKPKKPKKRKKHEEKLSFTGSHKVTMNEEVSLEEDFSDIHSLEDHVNDEISLESMENDEISLETMENDEISLETDCFLDDHAEKQKRLSKLKNKLLKGNASVDRLLSFDSDSLVRGFVFKEIFDRRDLFSKK